MKIVNTNKTLLVASQTGNLTVVLETLQAGVDINQRDQNSDTPLTLAARFGHSDIVSEILKVPNVNLNAQNKWGDTALIGAAMTNRPKVVEALLVQPGLDTKIQNGMHFTAAEMAKRYGHSDLALTINKHPEVTKSLRSLTRAPLRRNPQPE